MMKQGKVKDIYDLGDQIRFKFSDRVSAFDVKFKEPIPEKGNILCAFSDFWFKKLNVTNHMERRISNDEMIVKKLDMIPMECIVRGYFYGSFVKRYMRGEVVTRETYTEEDLGVKFTQPIFDPTTKDEHDLPVTKNQALELNLVTDQEYEYLKDLSIKIYNEMYQICDQAGFILVDIKLEFGKKDGLIYLADSIGPDEYRIWRKDTYRPGVKQDSYDKQILRDWLISQGYDKIFEEDFKNNKVSVPPSIPPEISAKITEKYLECFQKITNKTNINHFI